MNAPKIPSTHRIVPIIPTQDMLEECMRNIKPHPTSPDRWSSYFASIWKKMLEAAPVYRGGEEEKQEESFSICPLPASPASPLDTMEYLRCRTASMAYQLRELATAFTRADMEEVAKLVREKVVGMQALEAALKAVMQSEKVAKEDDGAGSHHN